MKKFFTLIATFVLLLVPHASHAANYETTKGESIQNYNVILHVNEKGYLDVEEDILYNFGNNKKHGIYRYIPLKQGTDPQMLVISDFKVLDDHGNSYKFTRDRNSINPYSVKIGDPNILVTGKKMYKIFYTIKNAQQRGEKDVINWNAIGDLWTVPIEQTEITLHYPSLFHGKILTAACFQGPFGSTVRCNQNTVPGDVFQYTISRLEPGNGASVLLELKKGTFLEPSLFEKLMDYTPLLLPIFLFLVLFLWWRFHGKDPKGSGTIITQFDAPDHLTPLEVGAIVDEKIQGKDVSAQIIYLARKGYLKVIEDPKTGLFGKNDFSLERTKRENETFENDFDKMLLDELFVFAKPGTDGVERVKLSSLKTKFARQFKRIQEAVYTSLIQKGYFPSNPMKVKSRFYLAAILLLYAVVKVFDHASFSTINIMWLVALGLCILLLFIFAPLMSVKTQKGVQAYEYILGFKTYLSVAEKDRINFHNAPEKNPTTFEALLPFAMTLGVEKAWAKYFEGMYMQPSSWYVSSATGNTFNSLYFANSLSNFSSITGSSISSSSRSGGGGGFSGGGGGGGGGGSW